MRPYPLLFILLLLTGQLVHAYGDDDIRSYIKTFESMAIREQVRTGIPASITLAQGILETGAGTSDLCVQAANHFGIKCNNGWQGPTFLKDDDKKDDCFRRYAHADSSYQDHSNFLKYNKRYAPLFDISPMDYEGWAHGLKKCGYATSSTYAQKLIGLINRFQLQQYTVAALNIPNGAAYLATTDNTVPVQALTEMNAVAPALNRPAASEAGYAAMGRVQDNAVAAQGQDIQAAEEDAPYYELTTLHGIRGFYAKKGDNLLEYAIKNRIRYARLLEINDLADAPLPQNMYIYLDKKKSKGSRPQHTVLKGETMQYISQTEGLRLDALRSFNRMEPGEEPAEGSVLQLQNVALNRPAISAGQVTHEGNSVARKEAGNSGMIRKEQIENLNMPDNVRKEIARQEGLEIEDKPIPAKSASTDRNAPKYVRNEIIEESEVKAISKSLPNVRSGTREIEAEPALPEATIKPVQPEPKYNSGDEELDEMKRRFDRSVYEGTNPRVAPPTPASPERNPGNKSTKGLNRPAKSSSQTITDESDPAAALRQHMEEVQNGKNDFVPKQTKK